MKIKQILNEKEYNEFKKRIKEKDFNTAYNFFNNPINIVSKINQGFDLNIKNKLENDFYKEVFFAHNYDRSSLLDAIATVIETNKEPSEWILFTFSNYIGYTEEIEQDLLESTAQSYCDYKALNALKEKDFDKAFYYCTNDYDRELSAPEKFAEFVVDTYGINKDIWLEAAQSVKNNVIPEFSEKAFNSFFHDAYHYFKYANISNSYFNLKSNIENNIKSLDFVSAYTTFRNINDVEEFMNIPTLSGDGNLDFMKEVVKIHGTNGEILKSAIKSITDFYDESPAFSAKLLNDTLKTNEYKEAFAKKQGKTEEISR